MWISIITSAIRVGRIIAISTTRAVAARGVASELVSFTGKQLAYRVVKLTSSRLNQGPSPYVLSPIVQTREASRSCYLLPSPEQLQDETPGLTYADAVEVLARWASEHIRKMTELGVEIPPLALTVEPGSRTARELLESGDDDLLPAALVATLAAAAAVGGLAVVAPVVAGAVAAALVPDAAEGSDGLPPASDSPTSASPSIAPGPGVLAGSLTIGGAPPIVTSPYGVKRGSSVHKGVDLRARTPEPVVLPCDGLVTWVRFDKRGGHSVNVLCAPGSLHPTEPVTVILRHLDPGGLPTEGATIPAGTMIARTGNTGTPSSGGPYVPHLHLETAVGAHSPKGPSFKKLLVDPASLSALGIPRS